MSRPRICVDFDGTLVEDEKYPEIGDWIPGAADAVRELCRHGDVVIYTCRVAPAHHITEEPRGEEAVQAELEAIRAKLAEEGLDMLEIWTKPWKPPAAVYIDNKAVGFRGDWHEALNETYGLWNLPMRFRDPERTVADDLEEAAMLADYPGLREDYPNGFEIIEVSDENDGWMLLPSGELVPTTEPLRHPSSKRFVDRVMGWIGLHDQKQKDYGTDQDPFANIRQSAEAMGLPAWIGCVIRMNDKMRRLNTAARQWIEAGKVSLANEGVIDSFDDMGVYSGIGGVLYEEWSE